MFSKTKKRFLFLVQKYKKGLFKDDASDFLFWGRTIGKRKILNGISTSVSREKTQIPFVSYLE
jgi:hypothetical protein